MIGRFPWEPFSPGEPDPGGPDPLAGALYRAAVQAADAYRSVRLAVRRESGVLRVGNRFVPDARYREVAFVSLGRAAVSMAFAALHVFGDRLTQGFVAGPDPLPPEIPFRAARVGDGWGGSDAAPTVVGAVREIASGLRASDLLLLLVSPGSVRALLEPPAGFTSVEFAGWLSELYDAGATAREVSEAARVLGTGGVGGRLLPAGVAADVQVLLVDRGDGPRLLGGGPTFATNADERARTRAALERLGRFERLPSGALAAVRAAPSVEAALPAWRPVVVANPSDALRAAGDRAFDKGWTVRVGFLELAERPTVAADRLVAKAEEVVSAERAGGGSKGTVVLGASTLDVPEGVPEGPACEAFVDRASAGLRRREMSVAVLRTAGAGPNGLAGAVVGALGDPEAGAPPGARRGLRMREGITDVGAIVAALVPARAVPPPARS